VAIAGRHPPGEGRRHGRRSDKINLYQPGDLSGILDQRAFGSDVAKP